MLTTPARGAQANFGSELSQIPGRVHAGQPPSTSHRSTGSKQSGSSIEYIDDENELRSIGRAQMAEERGVGRAKKERAGSIARKPQGSPALMRPFSRGHSPGSTNGTPSRDSSPASQHWFANEREENAYGRELANSASGVMDRRLLAAFNATNEALRRSIV